MHTVDHSCGQLPRAGLLAHGLSSELRQWRGRADGADRRIDERDCFRHPHRGRQQQRPNRGGGRHGGPTKSEADLTQLGASSLAYNGGQGGLLSMMLGADGFVYVSNTSGIFKVVLQ